MKAHLQYLNYVLRHKWFVFLACRRLAVPFWQSVFHDYTKFLPIEWFAYVDFFYRGEQSSKSSNGKVRKASTVAFEMAWNHHQKHNPHHWQYWVLIPDVDGGGALEMPVNYALEMIADWDGAGRAITGKSDPAGWYSSNKEKMILHPNTRQFVEIILEYAYDWKKTV